MLLVVSGDLKFGEDYHTNPHKKSRNCWLGQNNFQNPLKQGQPICKHETNHTATHTTKHLYQNKIIHQAAKHTDQPKLQFTSTNHMEQLELSNLTRTEIRRRTTPEPWLRASRKP
jgi:hypothetical protein